MLFPVQMFVCQQDNKTVKVCFGLGWVDAHLNLIKIYSFIEFNECYQ